MEPNINQRIYGLPNMGIAKQTGLVRQNPLIFAG